MKNSMIIGIFALILSVFASCTPTDFDPIPVDKLMGDSLVANYTVAELLEAYKSDTDKFSDIKLTTKNSIVKDAGLFTTKLIQANNDLIIKGVVTSSDVEGNIYKYMTIQETGVNSRAVKISIDASGLSAIYPVGQRVWVKLNGLYLGNYAQSPQIGSHYVNKTRVVVDTVNKVDVYRIEPGRIPYPIAQKAIHAFGMPDVKLAKADTMTIAQIRAGGHAVINKLVCIKNAYFTGRGADYGLPVALKDQDLIFAPSTNGIGYPQSREIRDPSGTIFISTSEFSKFASFKLPSSGNIGNITAIVGWYNDKKPNINPTSTTTEVYHQLTLRGIFDLGKGFDSYRAEVGK
ncbi:MAG: DUF5689 domain-containing protein [Paludibacter sp.]|nr:DUF5689 domain-containing protein [Paludibacter sp.]